MEEKRFRVAVFGGLSFVVIGLGIMYLDGFFDPDQVPMVLNMILGALLYAPGAYLGLFVLDRLEKKAQLYTRCCGTLSYSVTVTSCAE